MTKNDLLKSEIEVCDLQMARMEMAYNHLESILPLTKEKYLHLSDEEMGFLDMLTTRYSKLQDLMGNKIFPLFLKTLEENIDGASALDRIHRLEKLGYLKSSDDWIAMRAVRNSIAHEYPDDPDLMVSNINAAVASSRYLKSYWQKLRIQILDKLHLKL